MTISATKTKKISKTTKYLRIPIDDKIQKLIDEIQAENPFFDELDSIRYVIGKYIMVKHKKVDLIESKPKTKSFKEILAGSNFIDIEDEDEQFKFLKANGL